MRCAGNVAREITQVQPLIDDIASDILKVEYVTDDVAVTQQLLRRDLQGIGDHALRHNLNGVAGRGLCEFRKPLPLPVENLDTADRAVPQVAFPG